MRYIKLIIKWWHKRRALSHKISSLSYLPKDDDWPTNQHFRLYHEEWQSYHLDEFDKL